MNNSDQKYNETMKQRFDEAMKNVMSEIACLDKEILYLMLIKLATNAACAEGRDELQIADPIKRKILETLRVNSHILAAFYDVRHEETGVPLPYWDTLEKDT